MTGAYLEHLAEDRRLVILRALADMAGQRANESVIHAFLERLGHVVSRDVVRADFAWLNEHGLAAVESVHGVTVAALTGRGEDVAAGRSIHPGVKKPRARG